MPIKLPEKVRISPNATKTEWWISANGGQRKPAMSNVPPKEHIAIAVMSWKCFIESGNWTVLLRDRSLHSLSDR